MGFWVAFADNTGARNVATEVLLSPKPARIAYPEVAPGTTLETAGGVVLQAPTADTRTRTWFWDNYPAWMPAYQTLWNQIEPLRSRYRKLAGDVTPYVYLKEDETELLRTVVVSGTTVTPSFDWLRCRVIDVNRSRLKDGSSLVVYAETKLVFVIADPSFNDL